MTSLHRSCVQAAFFLLLAACGSSPPSDSSVEADATDQSNYYLGNGAVFATLISGSGGTWIFDKITESDLPPKSGFLVRLNDLAPAFDTRIAECAPQAYPTSHKCNPAHPFRSKNVGVVNKIISGGLAAGTGGKVTDVSRTYETSFEEAKFNQAVDEALINTGLDQDRQQLLEALNSYAVLFQTSRSTLSELENSIKAKHLDTSAVQLDIQPKLLGLTEYYTGDLKFRELVDLVPQATDYLAGSGIQAESLLPCDARLCARKAASAVATLRADIRRSEMRLQDERSFIYTVHCGKTSHAGYLFRLSCPDEITRTPTGAAVLPLSINILARDFDDLYPSMELRDDNLVVSIDSGGVSFLNLTSGYLSISAQTSYYNSKFQTTTSEISLAPGVTVKRRATDFVSPPIAIESSYRQMTPDKANSSEFEFGFAVKYGKAGDAVETTLLEKRAFNVGCVINNRLRPGSCVESPAAETGREEVAPVPF